MQKTGRGSPEFVTVVARIALVSILTGPGIVSQWAVKFSYLMKGLKMSQTTQNDL